MWLDLFAGTVLIIAILQGYKNGFIRALISFFSLFIGLLLAFQFAGWVAGQLKEHTKINSQLLPFISFLIFLFTRTSSIDCSSFFVFLTVSFTLFLPCLLKR